MGGLPLLISSAGPMATPPTTLLAALIAKVQALAPGYTSALPGSLIEDLSSTSLGILTIIDQARVDAVNAVSPYAANAYILNQQGQMLGIPIGQPVNGNVNLVVTVSANGSPAPGYVIVPGFLFSDGTSQYQIQDGGVTGAGGVSAPLYAVATNAGVFPIPANSVVDVVSSVPTPYTMTVTNPSAGVPASGLQTVESYLAQVQQAQRFTLQGSPACIRAALGLVPGVSPRLISVLQNAAYYEVICGGGDPFAVANAIYQSVSTTGLLTGAATNGTTVSVLLFDAPNSYTVNFVTPANQVVTGTSGAAIVWNTELPNFTAGAAVNQLMQVAATSYINSIPVGQPLNLNVLTQLIQTAVAPVLSAANLTTLTYTFNVNGTPVSPSAGTQIILSNAESYFSATQTAIVAVQG